MCIRDRLEEAISKVKEHNHPVILTYPLNQSNIFRYFWYIISFEHLEVIIIIRAKNCDFLYILFVFSQNSAAKDVNQLVLTQSVTESNEYSSRTKIEDISDTKNILRSSDTNITTSGSKVELTDSFSSTCNVISDAKLNKLSPTNTSSLIDSLYSDCTNLTVEAPEQALRYFFLLKPIQLELSSDNLNFN